MIIDIICILLIVLALFKGLRRGFIMAIFSTAAYIIGIAAALKLSSFAAEKLAAHGASGKWLPVLSFLVVFIIVVILVNVCGKLIQKSIETVMLGMVNRAAGALLYMFIYTVIFSVFLFYAVQLGLFKPADTSASVFYPYLQPIGPVIINGIGSVIPWFKDMFRELQNFFGNMPVKSA